MFVGTDIVYIPRFVPWHSYAPKKIQSVFTLSEYEQYQRLYEQENIRGIDKAAEFLASRFAVKEAFYKALSAYLVTKEKSQQPLFFACAPHIELKKHPHRGVPFLSINWDFISQRSGCSFNNAHTSVSLAHETEYALATVLLFIE